MIYIPSLWLICKVHWQKSSFVFSVFASLLPPPPHSVFDDGVCTQLKYSSCFPLCVTPATRRVSGGGSDLFLYPPSPSSDLA